MSQILLPDTHDDVRQVPRVPDDEATEPSAEVVPAPEVDGAGRVEAGTLMGVAFAKWCAVDPGALVLDVAAGTGVVVEPLTRRFGVRQVLAVDVTTGSVRAFGRDLPVVDGGAATGARRLPVGDAAVDHVTCAFAVDAGEASEPVLREVRRVLRPGGTVALALSGIDPAGLLAAAGFAGVVRTRYEVVAFGRGPAAVRHAAWFARGVMPAATPAETGPARSARVR